MTGPVVELCVLGTEAEFARRIDDARDLFMQAWDLASEHHDLCIAAHYVAHLEPDAHERLKWNRIALEHAEAADQDRVEAFYGSLFVNLGESYEAVGETERAAHFYRRAAERGVIHQACD